MELQDIIKSIDIEKLLKHYGFNNMKPDGPFLRSACKIHNGDNPTSFVINKETTLWFCHTECGGGDVFTLVQKMEGITFLESIKWLAEFFSIDITGINLKAKESKLRKEFEIWLAYQKQLNNDLEIKECDINVSVLPITSYRKFKKETLEFFNIGLVDSITLTNNQDDKYTIHSRLWIPIHFNETYIGFSLRRLKESDIMKWSHQPRHLPMSRILYNYDNVCMKDEIVVCEGIFDVMAFHEINVPAVCVFGSHISDGQMKLLLQTGADITFAFDNDTAGIAAKRKAVKALINKSVIRQLELPQGEDPESIPREDLKSIFDNRKRIYKEDIK